MSTSNTSSNVESLAYTGCFMPREFSCIVAFNALASERNLFYTPVGMFSTKWSSLGLQVEDSNLGDSSTRLISLVVSGTRNKSWKLTYLRLIIEFTLPSE